MICVIVRDFFRKIFGALGFYITVVSNNRQIRLVKYNQKNVKEVIQLKQEKDVKITAYGEINLELLSEEEQRAFLAILLARALELYRKQREEVK